MPIYTQFVFNYVQSKRYHRYDWFSFIKCLGLVIFKKRIFRQDGVVGETSVMMGKTFTRKESLHTNGDS